MFRNYILVAVRHIWRQRTYTLVNIAGLALGLTIFLFARALADYENGFDTFFPNAERIYAVSAEYDASVQSSISEGTHSAVGPLISENMTSVEAWARLFIARLVVGQGGDKAYQVIRFAEPAILDIFEFDIIDGDATNPLSDPTSVMVSERTAERYFGDSDPVGQVIVVNNAFELRVTAVFADLPRNSHLVTSLTSDLPFEFLATTEALANITDWQIEGDFDGVSTADKTYVLLKHGVSKAEARNELDAIFESHIPDRLRGFYSGYGLLELTSLNTFVWKNNGLPMITTLQVLGALILLVACINYANLATAQIIGRTREVGLRRTMGASRSQLYTQFLVEAITLALIAMVAALALLEFVIPLVNDATGKIIASPIAGGAGGLAGLVLIALSVGVLAGSYPAYLISRRGAISMLRGDLQHGKKGSFLRSVMLVVQFTISTFMIIAVVIIYAQNQKIQESGTIFEKDQIVTIRRISRPETADRWPTLKTELERIPGVERVTATNTVPFQQSHINSQYYLTPGDESDKPVFYRLSGDEDTFSTFGFDRLAGRMLDSERPVDIWQPFTEEDGPQMVINVMANEQLARRMGFNRPENAIGESFYMPVGDFGTREYSVVGIFSNKNYLGFFNDVKSTYYTLRPTDLQTASVLISGSNIPETLIAIDETWARIIPEFPIERRFLDEVFGDVYSIFEGINMALAAFAALAMVVASIGLFGMAAFMAERRTKEIGIRKVMGASVSSIVRLLVWQFSRPVTIAVFLASPLGYFATKSYLDFFPDRIGMSPEIYLITGAAALLIAGATVSVHAFRAARTNPVHALRYE